LHAPSSGVDDEALESFRIPNAAELIAAHLRRQIVRGELAEGTSLPPESKLRARFGVSGPTLRAAYRVLEAEGLITVRRGSRGGAEVHRPQLSVAGRYVGTLLQMEGTTLDDLYEARTVLEPPLAAIAATRASKDPAALATLREILDNVAASLGDTAAFARAASQFHQEVIRLAGNGTLSLLVNLLWHLVELQTANAAAETGMTANEVKKKRTAALHAHQRLLELIESGDAQGAEAFWRTHMTEVGKFFSKRHGGKAVVELFD
jgi:GntR family transcriptional regulator, transcriptional repressor for pyruvate dehydrogenase complex